MKSWSGITSLESLTVHRPLQQVQKLLVAFTLFTPFLAACSFTTSFNPFLFSSSLSDFLFSGCISFTPMWKIVVSNMGTSVVLWDLDWLVGKISNAWVLGLVLEGDLAEQPGVSE